MDRYQLFALFLLFLSPLAEASEKKRICYFSLNEEKEVKATRDFMNKLKASVGLEVEVTEFLSAGTNPNAAFKKMVESGVRCDGLVISGHHTGAWGGHRAKGRLLLDSIESLSCDPKHAEWFRNVNATWLQGCRTLGVGEVEANDQQVDADYHTNRVGRVLEADGLTQSMVDLNMEFSTTLDQDNPLSSRYLRLFPSSKLFGWTKSAPGAKSDSWKSIMYHMAQASRLMDEEEKFPAQTPFEANLSAESAARYADAVLLTLTRFSQQDRACEEFATQAWLAQGNALKSPRKPVLYFDNPDLKTLPSLAASGDESLLQAKKIDCLIKESLRTNSSEKMSQALDLIATNPDYLRYSFNTIVDARITLEKKKSPVAQVLIEKMRKHPGINEFLASRLKSKQTGTLRKIEFYKFSQDLIGHDDDDLEKEINVATRKQLLQALPPLDPTATNPARSRQLAVSFRATLFQSLLKNRLAKGDFYDRLLEGKPEADVLMQMTKQAKAFHGAKAKQSLLAIAASPNASVEVGNAVLNELATMNLPEQEYLAHQQDISNRYSNMPSAPIDLQPRRPSSGGQRQAPANNDPIGEFFRSLGF